MFHHIVVAHDLRSTADLALRRAAQLSAQHGARLTLLHVLGKAVSSVDEESIRQLLDRSLTGFAPAGTELRIVPGRAAETVLKQLRTLDVDLLVLGAHHQRHELFHGTTLDRVARHCPVPLLLVARDDAQPYRRALAALDFSLCACNAFGKAARLLPEQAALHALHVFDGPRGGLTTQRALIKRLLMDECQALAGGGPTISHAVLPGSIPLSLMANIKAHAPELLVLGSHSRGAVAHALLGSLAQHYLHKAPCDIFVVQ